VPRGAHLLTPGGCAPRCPNTLETLASSLARLPTLAGTPLQKAGAHANAALVVLASALNAAAAPLEIHLPWTPVPISGQTGTIVSAGGLLGLGRLPRTRCSLPACCRSCPATS
jgi:hypothetical protein